MFRITKFLNRSTTEIQVAFSENLSSSIGVTNVRVKSNLVNVSDLTVKSIDITGRVLTIETTPQSPNAPYYVELFSTATQPFISTEGNVLGESASTNLVFFNGLEDTNDIRDVMIDDLPPVYDTDTNTFVRKYISGLADQLLRLRKDIRETGNSNYLKEVITDEIKRRGFGPTDRLVQESTYKINRVSTTPEGATEFDRIFFNEDRLNLIADTDKVNSGVSTFGRDPISLRGVSRSETVSNSERIINRFEGLVLTLGKSNVIRLNSLTLTRDNTVYVYDIPTYGYSIANTRYDSSFSFPLLTLESNQIKLAEAAVISGSFVEPAGDDVISVNYTYIDQGKNVDTETVVVSRIRDVVRESVPTLATAFSLANFPIVNANDSIPTRGGVSFLDPNPSSGIPYQVRHPAFIREISFSESNLPSAPGEYAVNYNTGQVFVYGELTPDGTGLNPPVATYKYRQTFVEGVDYNLNNDTDEIVSVPGRPIEDLAVKVSFSFERVLIPGIDYIAHAHNEVNNELVENRLLSLTSIATLNTPITDVFEVRNETTGEIYRVSRFDDNKIEIAGRQLPRVNSVEAEVANFTLVTDQNLYVTEEIETTLTYKIVAASLGNNLIVSSTSYYGAANINSSLIFSDSSLFLREFFYDNDLQNLSQNLNKLSTIGDYLVDYKSGIVYLYADPDQSFDLGKVSYSHADLSPVFDNLYGVNSISYRSQRGGEVLNELNFTSFDANSVEVTDMPSIVERFYNGNTNKPILLGTTQFGSLGRFTPGSNSFVSADASFESGVDDDGYHTLRLDGMADRDITSVVSRTEITVDPPFTTQDSGVDWCIFDGNPEFPNSDGYKVVTNYDIKNVIGVYTVTDLQTNDRDSLTNYYDPEVDTVSNNQIIFNNSSITSLSPGTALAIAYSYGSLYLDYDYIQDNIRVSYEYGDNSIDFSINDSLDPNQEYFVSYEYGALREALITNFAALTQLDELGSVPLEFDRELFRDILKGTLQGFVNGPTLNSISNLVEEVTDIAPDIRELSFDEWTLGRDNLYLAEGKLEGNEVYRAGKYGSGLFIDSDTSLSFPSESYISYREGTFHSWVKPEWRGLDNDATLTFDLGSDGYSADSDGYGLLDGYSLNLDEIFIGSSAFNPTEMPFSISRFDGEPRSPIGRPSNFGSVPGYYIWYDDLNNYWEIAGVASDASLASLQGTITTSGKFYYVEDGYDGYTIDATDSLTSTDDSIRFTMLFDGYEVVDGYDGYVDWDGYDGYLFRDQIRFRSDDLHYIFDTGPSLYHNRMSMFKDQAGYLNFRVWDDSGKRQPGKAKQYNLSTDISDWVANDLHHVAASWRLNSSEGIDEMHLFVDGQEVSNLFKFGGRRETTTGDIYRTVASEVVTSSATKTIVGSNDGVSVAGSPTFTSEASNFIEAGVTGGDTLHILDSTVDGAGSPYTISSVIDANTLQLGSSLTLGLSDITFAVNQASFNVETDIDTEKFAVFAVDGYGVTRELNGLNAELPDYSISRAAGINTLTLNNNVSVGEEVFINTLGLTKGRCRDIVFKYDGYQPSDGYNTNTLVSRAAPPSSLSHFDVYKIPFIRTSIEDNESPNNVDGYFTITGNDADGYFTNLCQPSETVNGKKYDLTLGGLDNIDFTGTNTVTLYGSTFAGPTSEVITFNTYGTQTTTNFFTSLGAVEASFDGLDGYKSLGSLTIRESIPFTQSENGGDYAIPVSYDNGVVTFLVFGSGGDPYNLGSCHYQFDYPIDLNIPMSEKGRLYLGSDINGENSLNGVLDQVVFLNEMLDDIRAGEVSSGNRTITQDFNSPLPLNNSAQTLMLLPLDENLDNIDEYYVNFDDTLFTSSQSVNSNFGDAGIFYSDPLLVDNSSVAFNNDEGTVEFWVSPLVDTLFDENNQRYYLDITSLKSEEVLSTTAVSLSLGSRARKILSVRLVSDGNSGLDYFEGGSLGVDGRSIRLGRSLPGQQSLVRVEYVPVNFNGDRVSIYKDGYGLLNFDILASDELFRISYPISWRRGSWHRVKATWSTNSISGRDRMRLFVDGVQGGTILYGTAGLLYDSGVVYGSAAVGSSDADFLVTDINLTDTFGEVYLGNSFDFANPSKVKLDNVRFSSIARSPSIVAGSLMDLNYNSNLAAALPVINDSFTTLLLDFNSLDIETSFLANLLSETTPLFQLDVNIDDSFERVINDADAKELLIKIISRMKPSHVGLLVKFLS